MDTLFSRVSFLALQFQALSGTEFKLLVARGSHDFEIGFYSDRNHSSRYNPATHRGIAALAITLVQSGNGWNHPFWSVLDFGDHVACCNIRTLFCRQAFPKGTWAAIFEQSGHLLCSGNSDLSRLSPDR